MAITCHGGGRYTIPENFLQLKLVEKIPHFSLINNVWSFATKQYGQVKEYPGVGYVVISVENASFATLEVIKSLACTLEEQTNKFITKRNDVLIGENYLKSPEEICCCRRAHKYRQIISVLDEMNCMITVAKQEGVFQLGRYIFTFIKSSIASFFISEYIQERTEKMNFKRFSVIKIVFGPLFFLCRFVNCLELGELIRRVNRFLASKLPTTILKLVKEAAMEFELIFLGALNERRKCKPLLKLLSLAIQIVVLCGTFQFVFVQLLV